MPPKRKADYVLRSGENQTKLKLDEETRSITALVEPFRLLTAIFPVDDTTSKWSAGHNRNIDDNHVKRLCQIFRDNGLQRLDRAHRLHLLCSPKDVRQMCNHLGIKYERNEPDLAVLPYFKSWAKVTEGGKAEVLAGNHRIHALKAYLGQETAGQEENDHWWACDIFDRDKLPRKLQIELRANHNGTVLPDSHGQVWTELCAYTDQDEQNEACGRSREDNETLIIRALGLSTRQKFPSRRLFILWRNNRWREFITRFCSRSVGKDLFNISVFQQLSSFRIDDYLFERLQTIVSPMNEIWERFGIDLELKRDYKSLRQSSKPLELFYPGVQHSSDVDQNSPRRPGFLSHIDNAKYFSFFHFLDEDRHVGPFPDGEAMLQRLRLRGKTMQEVMKHVVMWLNNNLADIKDRHGNKPALVDELPPMLHMPDLDAQEDYIFGHDSAHRAPMLSLQRSVLQFVEEHAMAFTADDLNFLPRNDVEPEKYQERFRLEEWRGVLLRVRDAAQGNLRNPCVSSFIVEPIVQPPQLSERSVSFDICSASMQCNNIAKGPLLRGIAGLATTSIVASCQQRGVHYQHEVPDTAVSVSKVRQTRDDPEYQRVPATDWNNRSSESWWIHQSWYQEITGKPYYWNRAGFLDKLLQLPRLEKLDRATRNGCCRYLDPNDLPKKSNDDALQTLQNHKGDVKFYRKGQSEANDDKNYPEKFYHTLLFNMSAQPRIEDPRYAKTLISQAEFNYTQDHVAPEFVREPQQPELFASPAGSFSDVHIDHCTPGIAMAVEDTCKIFIVWPPSESNLKLLDGEPPGPERLARIFDRLEGGHLAIVTKDTPLYLSSGTLHAVVTVRGGFMYAGNFLTAGDGIAFLRAFRFSPALFERYDKSSRVGLMHNLKSQIEIALEAPSYRKPVIDEILECWSAIEKLAKDIGRHSLKNRLAEHVIKIAKDHPECQIDGYMARLENTLLAQAGPEQHNLRSKRRPATS